MLHPVNLPPGIVKAGTDLQASGRWIDGNLVRWKEGSLRPIEGWRDFATIPETPRGLAHWVTNTQSRWYVAGTYDGLYSITSGGQVADITPAGYTSGLEIAEVNLGYGGGYYGADLYGTERPENDVFEPATTWALDNWGEYLIACADTDGKLYEWTLSGQAAVIANAPTDCLSVMVTQERFVFALGAGGDVRKVQWCDQEDNTTWTASATNQAGDIRLKTEGQIMQGLRARGGALILTDVDAHFASYIGPPYVYSIEQVGESCGAISRKAAAAYSGGAIWMGESQFFHFDGANVVPLSCDVQEFVFAEMNADQSSLVFAVPNAANDEIWWFFPDENSTENSRYVSYNHKDRYWGIGYMSRSTGVDKMTSRFPVMFAPGGQAYQHEVGSDYDGGLPYAETGPIVMGNGDEAYMVRRIIPDEGTGGSVQVSFKTRRYPNAPEYNHGPYSAESPTSVRLSGRQVRLKVQSIDGSAQRSVWRWGVPRLDIAKRGAR